MTHRKKRGPLSKTVKELCFELLHENAAETDFKQGLSDLIHDYSKLGKVCFQDIGMALQKWATEYSPDRVQEVWQLADEVDQRIRKGWAHWRNSMFR